MKKNSSVTKRTHSQKFFDDVISGAEGYRRSYRSLKNCQRVERVEFLAKNVLSACISRSDAVKNGKDYLVDNQEFQVDVLTLLGELTMRLERKLKCNFRLEDKVTPSSDQIESESLAEKESVVKECGFFQKKIMMVTKKNLKLRLKCLAV